MSVDGLIGDIMGNPWPGERDKPIGHDYEVLPDGRIPLWVMLIIGDDAHVVTPWDDHDNPRIVSASAIGRDCTMPAGECIGREFTATGDRYGLHDFRLVHDPRL
ncbi:hypothetical protein ACIP5Y_21740 [Nocardia sp. NPDC088792]|uniref:hypothetical protein n=1 Tax=Nocardia sp. NPDC088792 TaxID=3364332 RepID=UPI00380F721A